jgi:hypothetical protein
MTGERIWNLITGLLIVGLGMAILMGNFDLFSARILLARYWPVLMLLVGTRLLILHRNESDMAGGLFWLATGALFFFSLQGWINAPVRNLILPVLIIWFGVMMLYSPGCSVRSRNGGDHERGI